MTSLSLSLGNRTNKLGGQEDRKSPFKEGKEYVHEGRQTDISFVDFEKLLNCSNFLTCKMGRKYPHHGAVIRIVQPELISVTHEEHCLTQGKREMRI